LSESLNEQYLWQHSATLHPVVGFAQYHAPNCFVPKLALEAQVSSCFFSMLAMQFTFDQSMAVLSLSD